MEFIDSGYIRNIPVLSFEHVFKLNVVVPVLFNNNIADLLLSNRRLRRDYSNRLHRRLREFGRTRYFNRTRLLGTSWR